MLFSDPFLFWSWLVSFNLKRDRKQSQGYSAYLQFLPLLPFPMLNMLSCKYLWKKNPRNITFLILVHQEGHYWQVWQLNSSFSAMINTPKITATN